MGYVVNELFRFRMLMAGVYVGIAISSTYGFSVLTEHLRSKYNFSQSDITTISTVGNCVGYLSFFAGMLFDFGGPKAVFPIAGLCGFLGFLLFGLAMDDTIKLDPADTTKNVICFSIFNAILYLGCPAMDVATLMPLMMNFPLDRGYMVIIQKTFSGLGTSVLMAYFNGFFRNPDNREDSNYSGYVYFVGAELLFCGILGMIFIDLPPYVMCQYRKKRVSPEELKEREGTLRIYMSQHAPRRRLAIGVTLVLVNLIFLTIVSIVTGYVHTHKSGHLAIAILAICILALFAVMALPFQFLGKYTPVTKSHKKYAQIGWVADESKGVATLEEPSTPANEAAEEDTPAFQRRQSTEESRSTNVGKKVGEPDALVAEVNGTAVDDTASPAPAAVVEAKKKVRTSVGDPQYGGSFWRHLLTPDLWLLWLSFFGMWGTGTVMQMNSSQIYRSKNYGEFDAARNTLYVALIGVGSAIGRIASGVIDMRLQHMKRQEDRRRMEEGAAFVPSKYFKYMLTTIFLPVGPFLLFIAYLLFALVPADALIVPFLIGAIGTGAGWGLGSLSVRIMYAEDIGKHYNMMFSSGFICTIALNRFMFGEMYDNQARKQGTAPACNQPSCVRDQMWILMAVNVMSTITAITAHYRFQRFVMRKRKEAQALLDLDDLDAIAEAASPHDQGRDATSYGEPFSSVEGDDTHPNTTETPERAENEAAAATRLPPHAQEEKKMDTKDSKTEDAQMAFAEAKE